VHCVFSLKDTSQEGDRTVQNCTFLEPKMIPRHTPTRRLQSALTFHFPIADSRGE
jgi:hypothetical protein